MNEILWFSHFSGGGGSTIGAIQAGFKPVLGIEWDEKISSLYRRNCGEVINEDISKVNIFEVKKYVPLLHQRQEKGQILVIQTSPPCQEFSQANSNKNQDSERATVLDKTWKFYALFKPEYVVLENVRAYIKSDSYFKFKNFLQEIGYELDFEEIINCADYGVPQSRVRLIAVWRRKGVGRKFKLTPTHVFPHRIGWYEAIKDLLQGLRNVTLTEKQGEAVRVASMFGEINSTLVDSDNSTKYKTRTTTSPSFTVTAGQSFPKAVLVERIGYRRSPKVREEDLPSWTIRASIADDGKGGTREDLIDVMLANAEVKALDVRCLARLQSFPDSYIFSGKTAVDVKVIGNSVPPLLMQKISLSIAFSLADDRAVV